jgi:hypothetical protein
MIGAITIFWESSFILSFVGLVIWGWVHIWGGGRENKMSKNECETFYQQIRMNHLTWFLGGKIPWSYYLYSIMILNTISLADKSNDFYGGN